MPGVDPQSYTSFDARVRHAQAAERGKLQFLFLPDGPSHVGDIEREPPHFNLDVMMTLAAVARETSRIGQVAPQCNRVLIPGSYRPELRHSRGSY